MGLDILLGCSSKTISHVTPLPSFKKTAPRHSFYLNFLNYATKKDITKWVISSLIIPDYILPIHSAKKTENNPEVHKIQIIEIL